MPKKPAPKPKTKPIRVRIAPSPTGPLHLGTARTALFNWLFARHNKGVFILRIEDTDTQRSKKEHEENILEGLKWLGLTWDEGPVEATSDKRQATGKFGPYRQSECTDIYEKYLKKLLDEDKAYYCYCTKEELEIEAKAMFAAGEPSRYSGKCRKLKTAPEGKTPQVIRFRMPKEVVTFTDLIRGEISFDMSLAGDITIAKDLRTPLYNFAVTVDDYEMKISHVIRGEDHIANTPKQIVMQRALGIDSPEYAHLPLILNSDKSKLSKRYVETSLIAYRDQGYLPEALVNFIAFLGWHPKDEREVMSVKELVKEFDLTRVQKSGAVFNEEKLNWLNAQYIKNMKISDLMTLIAPLLATKNISVEKGTLEKMIAVEKDRMSTFGEFIENTAIFFALPEYETGLLLWKDETREKARKNLQKTLEILALQKPQKFDKISLEATLMPYAEGVGKGEVLWPLRVALSGAKASPGPFEIMEVLEKDETISRVKKAVEKLQAP